MLPSWQQFLGWMENKGIYTIGRFMLGAALALGGAFGTGGISFGWAVATLFAGTAALQGFNTWRRQSYVESDLLNTYRDEIAAKLDMPVENVTRENLHQVAYGDYSIKLGGNQVLQAELERSGKRMWMEIGTTMAAVLTSIGAYYLLAPIELVQTALQNVASVTPDWFGPATPDKVGIMLASGAGMGLFNNAYDRVAARLLGLNGISPTDLIRSMQRDIGRGVHISQEQVFGVYAAALPTVAEAVDQHFGKPYHELDEEQQYDALKIYGKNFPIEKLTIDINSGVIEPDELAFIAVGQTSGVARKTLEQVQAEAAIEEEKTVTEKVMDTAKEILGDHASKESPKHTDQASVKSHVERVGGKRVDDLSHVERLMKEDAAIIDQLPSLR